MRNFLKIFLRSLGTYLGLEGGLTQPLVIVGFNRLVILITHMGTEVRLGGKFQTKETASMVKYLIP